MAQGLDFHGAVPGRKGRKTARCPTLGSASHTSETERRWESGKRTERGCSLQLPGRGRAPAGIPEERDLQSWRKSPRVIRPSSRILRRELESPAPEHSPPTQKEGSRAHTPGSPAPLCRPAP